MIRFRAHLTAFLALVFLFSCKGAPSSPESERIREPEFTITSIRILQAELINTRFRVKVRINNPNPFPVELSSLRYKLYGAGRFWAEGTEKDVFLIPPGGSEEKELYLVMNFIEMRRDLLDRIIALKNVRYRFTGTVEVAAGTDRKIIHSGSFDLEGESEVSK
jgi:LEA14-like dessication related protein